jgi:hypothetical protein
MEDSEFKVFKLVEDTVEAVVTFTDRLFHTCFYLAFYPHHFADKWSDEANRQSFVKPFTFTAISVFALYLTLVQAFRLALIVKYGHSFAEIPGNWGHYVALPRLFAYAIPTIILVYWLARLFRRVATWSGGNGADAPNLGLYAFSIACLAYALRLGGDTVLANLTALLPLWRVLKWGLTIWGFGSLVILLGFAISRQTHLAKWKAMFLSAAYGAMTFACVVIVLTIGIAIEVFPTWEAHAGEVRQAEMDALMKRIIDPELDERDKEAAARALVDKMMEQREWERRKSLHSTEPDRTAD